MAIIVTEFDGVEKGCIDQEFVATPVTLEPMDSDEITLNSEEITDINNQVVAQVHQLESLNAFELGEINKAFEALLVTESLYNEDLTQYQKEKRLSALESLDFSLPSMESNEKKEKGILTRIWEWIKNAFESFKKRMLKVGQWIRIQVKKMVRAIHGKNKATIAELEALKRDNVELSEFVLTNTLISEVFFTKPIKDLNDLIDCIKVQNKGFSELISICSLLRFHYNETFKKLEKETADKIFTKEELTAMIKEEISKITNRIDSDGIKIEDSKVVAPDGSNKYHFKDIPTIVTNEDYSFNVTIGDLVNLSKVMGDSLIKLASKMDGIEVFTDRVINSIDAELKTSEKFMKEFLKARKETMKDRNVGFIVDKEAVNHDRLVVKTRITLLQELISNINADINNTNIYLLNPVVKYLGRLGEAGDAIVKFVKQARAEEARKANRNSADKADSE